MDPNTIFTSSQDQQKYHAQFFSNVGAQPMQNLKHSLRTDALPMDKNGTSLLLTSSESSEITPRLIVADLSPVSPTVVSSTVASPTVVSPTVVGPTVLGPTVVSPTVLF